MEAEAQKTKKIGVYILSFALPAVLFLIALAAAGNYPFGDGSFAIWDMKLQYLDFFSWLKRVLSGEASLYYSFGKSLGGNTIGLFAYYLSSPFNLLLLFFDDIQLFVVVIAALKIGTCGLMFAFFARHRFAELKPVWIILLAACYASMAYNLDQTSNIMWLDGVYMLPLIMLGVYRLAAAGRRGMLYVSVTGAILINWYTAYMCCLFSAFYFLYEKIRKENFEKKQIKKRYVIPFIHYCITMILAVGSSMFFFLPVIMNLLEGKGADAGSFVLGFRCNILELLEGLIPGNAGLINSSVLILFCGTLTLAGAVGYFLSRKFTRKEKLFGGIMMGFLVFSAVFMPLENVWNGFRTVASYYCRFSFIICCFMGYLAAGFLEKWKISGNSKVIAGFCGLIVAAELFYNDFAVIRHLNYESAEEYVEYARGAQQSVASLRDYDSDAFYRTEQTSSYGLKEGNYFGTYNEGMAYGSSPLASYSSTYDALIADFYIKCGYTNTDRLILYNEPILLIDSLLGIKYNMSKFPLYGYERTSLEPYNQKSIYQNPYALGLGCMVSDQILPDIHGAANNFEYQNQLISKMLGREAECFKKVDAKLEKRNGEWIWTLNSPNCENILYGYLTRRGANLVDIYVDGEFRTDYGVWNSYRTFQISDDSSGCSHTVSMKGSILVEDGVEGIFYYLDMEVFRSAIAELKTREFQPAVFKDGYVEGSYYSQEDGNLLLTIPYDRGWKITCNGEEVIQQSAQGVFTVIPVKSGENKIVMEYRLPGFFWGCMASCFSIIGFAGWQLSKNWKRKG